MFGLIAKPRSVWRAGLLSWSPGVLGLAAAALLALLARWVHRNQAILNIYSRHQIGRR